MKSNHLLLTMSTLLTLCVVAGCGGSSEPAPKPAAQPTTDAKHSHGNGPHDGAVGDWGGGAYHVEFTVDHDKQEATIYVLGGDEKTAAPVHAKDGKLLLSITKPAFQVELMAAPLAGESENSASRYVGKHEKLGVVQEFAGMISGEVDGTPYVGEFSEEPHAIPEDK